MNLTVLNGTAKQRQWVADAIAACTYDFRSFDTQVNVSFTGLTACTLKHTYMCTSQQGPSLFEIQIEPWADDPRAPDNQGLPDVYRDLHEFFIESFIHEMGHVTCFFLVNTTALQSQLCSYFVHRPDGRRGTLADYSGPESTQRLWADRIKEGVAEWFRLAFLPHTQIYQNRTNWDLSPADFKKALALLLTSNTWEYGEPIMCSTGMEFTEEGTFSVFTLLSGLQDVRLKRLSAYNPSFYDEAEYIAEGGEDSTWAFDYVVSLGAPASAADLVNDDAGPWSGQGPLLVAFVSGGDIPGSGTDFYFVDPDLFPPPVDIIRNPLQPWASHSHLGSPRLTLDKDARSWWTHDRALLQTITLPTPRPDWGQLEITFFAQLAGYGGSAGSAGNRSTASDIHGAIIPGSFSDDPPPWGGEVPPYGINPVTGIGPFHDGFPPNLGSGWMMAYHSYEDIEFFSNGVFGFVKWFTNSGYRDVIGPTNPPPSFPPSGGNGDTFIQSVVRLDANQNGIVYNIGPTRGSYQITTVWTGPMANVDWASAAQLTARFFPVRKQSGGNPPPFPTQFLGNANAGPQAGGSIRSHQPPALAGRQTHVVDRIGGGGSIKPS